MKDKIKTCNASLQLGLGVGNYAPLAVDEDRIMKEKDKPMVCLGLSFDHLGPKEEDVSNGYHQMISNDQFEEDYANKETNKNAGVGGSDGKKLRLSKEQSNTLEENFNIQNTPSLAQRQALADKLNIKPRQVEVWFQNRRARTKLKLTEVNCQVLKKCCESLRGENKRLKKELQDLRSVIKIIQPSKPFYIQANSKATTMLTICPFEEEKQNSNE